MGRMKDLWMKLDLDQLEAIAEREEMRAVARLDTKMQRFCDAYLDVQKICEARMPQVKSDAMGRGRKVKEPFIVHAGTYAPLVPLGTHIPYTKDRVSNCLSDIKLLERVQLTCPSCDSYDWRYFLSRLNKPVRHPDDVGNNPMRCIRHPSSDDPDHCEWTGRLYSLMNVPDRSRLCQDVTKWMTEKGISISSSQDYLPCYRKQESTCEADKPEGTRDVEKFLREQQDKLWREGL